LLGRAHDLPEFLQLLALLVNEQLGLPTMSMKRTWPISNFTSEEGAAMKLRSDLETKNSRSQISRRPGILISG
jgi:hypothetical protein